MCPDFRGATRGFAVSYEPEASGMCWACPAPPRYATWRSPCRRIRGAAGGPKPHGNRCVPGGKSSPQRGGRAWRCETGRKVQWRSRWSGAVLG